MKSPVKCLPEPGPSIRQVGRSGMYDQMKRHDVHLLRNVGMSLPEIAEKLRLGKATVVRILKEPEPDATPPASLALEHGVGRPSLAKGFEVRVREILKEEPELPTVEILRRVREQGYRGGKSALYELVRQLRPRNVQPMVRFEGLAGEFSQHDFGKVRVRYLDGQEEGVHFFASRLK